VRSLLAIVAGLGLAAVACGDGEVNTVPDAARPVVDPAPYYQACTTADPASCPAPYACVYPDRAHDPLNTVCLVPCDDDRECPDGHFCNGFRQSSDLGATFHCVNEI
jgi:hypothetical protein